MLNVPSGVTTHPVIVTVILWLLNVVPFKVLLHINYFSGNVTYQQFIWLVLSLTHSWHCSLVAACSSLAAYPGGSLPGSLASDHSPSKAAAGTVWHTHPESKERILCQYIIINILLLEGNKATAAAVISRLRISNNGELKET